MTAAMWVTAVTWHFYAIVKCVAAGGEAPTLSHDIEHIVVARLGLTGLFTASRTANQLQSLKLLSFWDNNGYSTLV